MEKNIEDDIINIKENKGINNNEIENEKNNFNEEIKILSSKKSDFEQNIINAYLQLQNSENNNNNENMIKECEKYLIKVLNISENNEQIMINKNILDKFKRICKHQKLNLLILIAKIYMNLLSKKNLFSPEKFDEILLIDFINEVINLNKSLKETSLILNFERITAYFFKKIIDKYKINEEQKEIIEEFIINIQQKYLKPTILIDTFENMVCSLYESLHEQESLFDQYNVVIDNKENIIGCILNSNVNEKGDHKYYFDLGKILCDLLFNEYYIIKTNSKNSVKSTKKLIYYGNENEDFLNLINDMKYKIIIDDDINNCRKQIIPLIIIFIEKYRKVKINFNFLFLLNYIMQKIYFYYYNDLDEDKKKFDLFLSENIIDICEFKTESNLIEITKQFMKNLLKSKKTQDKNLKDLITKKLDLLKSNSNYNFETIYQSNINPKYDPLNLNDINLKICYFNKKEILAGKQFSIYIELLQPYSILEMTWFVRDYDINFSIENVENNEEIIKMSKINSFECPYKIIIFNKNKGIFKISFDNSYSWINNKTIKFNYNIFYPVNCYSIQRNILIIELKKLILNDINLENKKELFDKIILVKYIYQFYAFNCQNLFNNILKIQKLREENKIIFCNIYIETLNKKFFDEKINSFDLNKKNFEIYLEKLILDNEKIYLINLFNINNKNIQINNIKEILGFIPELKNFPSNLTYFSFNISIVELIYDLYNLMINEEDIDIIIHINYIKINGYQISIFQNNELYNIKEILNDFENTNDIEKNNEIIANYINNKKENNIKIFISSCDSDDNLCQNLGKTIENKILDVQKKNCQIIIREGKKYLNEIYNFSSILFIDE